MRRMNGILAVAAVVGLGALASCGTWVQKARFSETRRLEVDHVAGSGLDVQSRNGGVAVRVADVETVHIDATIRALTAERLEATEVLASRDEGGTLLLRVAWPEGQRQPNEGVSFDIRVPDASGVTIDTGNGPIVLEGTAGAASLHTSNGRIEVAGHDGPLMARSSNGRLTLSAITGEIDVETSNGRIEIEGARGPVGARTSNGRISLGFDERGVGPLRLRTSNGSVVVRLPRGFAGTLRAQTSNGGVHLDGLDAGALVSSGRGHAVLGFGDGEDSEIRTSNGGVTIRTAGGEG